MWECPNCGAPQAETARCWVCHRSSTTCSTCRHFRTSLSADLGWCALDPKRRPLTGLEQRGCWQERSTAAVAAAADVGVRAGRRLRSSPADSTEPSERPALDFIPVELIGRLALPSDPAPASNPISEPTPLPPMLQLAGEADEGWAERTSLFGDPDA